LRSGLVRIRLALFVPYFCGLNVIDAGRTGFGLFDVGMNFVMRDVSVVWFGGKFRCRRVAFTHDRGVRMTHSFAGKRLNVRAAAIDRSCRGRGFVCVAVVVVFEIFENVADVQEGVAVQTDIHECRLHAG
jgi:hypothetical protein